MLVWQLMNKLLFFYDIRLKKVNVSSKVSKSKKFCKCTCKTLQKAYLCYYVIGDLNDFIKVITGVRRSGKSTLLLIFKDLTMELQKKYNTYKF